jgi:hypothetical protein
LACSEFRRDRSKKNSKQCSSIKTRRLKAQEMLVPARGRGSIVIAQAEFEAAQIRHRSFTQPVSADRCDEEEYRKSIQQPISMSEALLQEEHAIQLLTAAEPQEPDLLRGRP